MKFTNVKQLIIKFMGGGLINFPTRFLRWVKINGDTDDSDDGGGSSSSDVFFVPATIQPKYFVNEEATEPIEIKDYTPDIFISFLYNKEDIISLGVSEEALDNLDYIGIPGAYDDVDDNNGANGYPIERSAFNGKIILSVLLSRNVRTYGEKNCYVYKIADDVFIILESSDGTVS